MANNEVDSALLLNAVYRKDRLAMWMLGFGRLLAIPVLLVDGGLWVNIAAYDGACGVLTAIASGWEVCVSCFSFLFCVLCYFGLIDLVGF